VQHTPVPDAMHIHKPWTDPTHPFWGVILGAFYGGTFYWGMDQVNVQRMLGARDLKQARWGAKWEPFQGLADWRMHLAILSLMTLAAYWWMW
jgi:uncharacterized sodium:solute symporter family permease YidK